MPFTSSPFRRIRKLFSGGLVITFGLWAIGFLPAFLIYSWQYAKQHGFLAWLLLGEIIPLLKATVWPIIVIIALLRPSATPISPQHELPSDSNTLTWQQEEYTHLIAAVDAAQNNELSTSYSSGPEGHGLVTLTIRRETSGSLLLVLDNLSSAPAEEIVGNGENVTVIKPQKICIRDEDIDGDPDSFQVILERWPKGLTPDEEFRPLRNEAAILAAWHFGIRYAMRRFVHISN